MYLVQSLGSQQYFCVCLVLGVCHILTPPGKGTPAACLTQKDVLSKKQPVLGSNSSHAVNMCSRQSTSLKTRCFSQASIMSVLSSGVWKCWLKFLYPGILLRYLSMAERSGEQPQHWNPSHCYRAVTFHCKCQLPACYSGFLANIGDYNSVLGFWGFFCLLLCLKSLLFGSVLKTKSTEYFWGFGKVCLANHSLNHSLNEKGKPYCSCKVSMVVIPWSHPFV